MTDWKKPLNRQWANFLNMQSAPRKQEHQQPNRKMGKEYEI